MLASGRNNPHSKDTLTVRAVATPGLRSAKAWITLFALLAFFLQNLAVQTHVHQLFQQPARVTAEHSPAPPPLKNDPIDQCRLCQELAHAGHYVVPSAAITIAHLTFVAAILSVPPEQFARLAPAFAWHSRAPPRR